MKPLLSKAVLATLLCSVALPGALAGRAVAGSGPAGSTAMVRPPTVAPAPGELELGRAAMERRRGNLRGVVEALEGLDFAHGPKFPGADRAAFLLLQAYRQLGDAARHDSLAAAVGTWTISSAYTRLIAFEHDFADNASPRALEDMPMDDRSPLGLYAEALREANSGTDDPARWEAIAVAETTSALGRDLAGAALLHLGSRALAGGEDARPWLERVPAGSRYEARALHLRGLVAIEHGDAAAGVALLESSLADSAYGARREVLRTLASEAMARGDWDRAQEFFGEADRDWTGQRDALHRLLSGPPLEGVWATWDANPDSSGNLVIDATDGRRLAERYADASSDLVAAWNNVVPTPGIPNRRGGPWPGILPPAPGALAEAAASARAVTSARGAWERTRWAADRESEALADQRRYLGLGLEGARKRERSLAPRLARLDSLRSRIDSLDARLRWLRDAEARRVAARLDSIIAKAGKLATWMEGMRRLYVCGPDSASQLGWRDGTPGAARALATERELNASLAAEAARMRDATPGLLARSYEKVWGPRLIDRVVTQALGAATDLRWARSLSMTLDSSLAAAKTSPSLERMRAKEARLVRRADSLAVRDRALRERLARGAIDRTLAAMQSEREPIDYGLAASAYALAVQLVPRDSASAGTVASGSTGSVARRDSSAGPTGVDERPELPETTRLRSVALSALRTFLRAHPDSPARAEVRFRLADLELLAAKQVFQQQMAAFLDASRGQHVAGDRVPVLDSQPALTLYRSILSDDPDFEHLDAVRFNAGMILADEGDPEARRYFHELVTLHPASTYCQEAWLRMGDMAFNEKHFAECAGLYEHAAQGGDPTLAVIANYKLGWAHFNQDDFLPAADAFRSVLDLYGAGGGPIGVDIQGESESYLVHSLAGAGGASAFASYFDRVGTRPYEKRVLMALGQHFRLHGAFSSAAEVDELVLARLATEPEALVAAQRLVETQQRAGDPARLRAARATYAPMFAPGGAWYEAQPADSARAAGMAFARSSYLAEATEHQARSHESNSPDEWSATRLAFEELLTRWPGDPDAAEFHLAAGEASLKLAGYRGALAHFAAAAGSSNDSLATLAMLQRVTATDAWYESTRGRTATGSDSLARAFLAAGDELLARSPRHPRATDVLWRESQLAIAHGWNERAADDLSRLAGKHPEDARAPLAAIQRAELLFAAARFADAGKAFEFALAAARTQGRDSLARRAAAALPVCAYREADAAVAADSSRYERHAALFERVATEWPDDELAPRASYRSGLAYGRAGRPHDAVRVLRSLLRHNPHFPYASDARLQLAAAWEAIGDRDSAAQAYLEFSRNDADRASAAAAWLKAAELLSAAGRDSSADALRLAYLGKYPEDQESAMQITETFARRDLAGVGPGYPVSSLLGPPRHGPLAGRPSHLADYMRRAGAHPALASRGLLAQVKFLQGEEAREAFAARRLTQPLAKSIPAKKRLLDTLLVRYRRSADAGVTEWAHASAFRMGQALVDFATALEHSDPPSDLAGDDLRAYQGVLADRARVFSVRGEQVWTDLLRRQGPDEPADPWLDQARAALWQRLAYRFLFKPEVEFPLVRAVSQNERSPR